MTYRNAITRIPGRSIVSGLSRTEQPAVGYMKALEQHQQYSQALKSCGLNVLELDAIEEHPDATFVEDVAILTPECAIFTAPGAISRKGELRAIEPVLRDFYPVTFRITEPGTLEGGDILPIGRHFYIGQSKRTNSAGAQQLLQRLKPYGISGSIIPVHDFLHLKTGVTWVGQNTLVATGEFINHPAFQNFNIIAVPAEERGAANCLRINRKIILPAGCPRTKQQLARLGTELIEVDISEFAKIDGGLSCLSLRY